MGVGRYRLASGKRRAIITTYSTAPRPAIHLRDPQQANGRLSQGGRPIPSQIGRKGYFLCSSVPTPPGATATSSGSNGQTAPGKPPVPDAGNASAGSLTASPGGTLRFWRSRRIGRQYCPRPRSICRTALPSRPGRIWRPVLRRKPGRVAHESSGWLQTFAPPRQTGRGRGHVGVGANMGLRRLLPGSCFLGRGALCVR